MATFGATRMIKVGDSTMCRVPAQLKKDKAYPFKADEADFIMEISKDIKRRPALVIRRP